MPHKGWFIGLVIVTLLLAIAVLVAFPSEQSSAIGQVMAAFAGTLAAVLFWSSLHYQSQQLKEQQKQLKEQREQFLENFKQLREDNRRSALLVVRDLLSRAEEKALKSNPELHSVNELMTVYMGVPEEWAIMATATTPGLVIEAGKKWIATKEAPAIIMMRGIKNAAETYFRATGTENIDYSMEPERFVFTYGPTLWKLPFFDEYGGVMAAFPEILDGLTPGREAAKLAYMVAAFKQALNTGEGDMFLKDEILEDIKKHKAAGYPMPAIARDLLAEVE